MASLLASGAKLTDQALLINALDEDADGALSASAKRIGGPLLFGKIWERLGVVYIIRECCWAFWFMVMRRACFRAASWSGRRKDQSQAWLRGLWLPIFCGLGSPDPAIWVPFGTLAVYVPPSQFSKERPHDQYRRGEP